MKIPWKSKVFTSFLIVLVSFVFSFGVITAQIDCQNVNPSGFSAGDADYCAGQLDAIIKAYLPAQQNNKKNLASLQSQLDNINKRISA